MPGNPDQIRELQQKIESLLKRQSEFVQEIIELRSEVSRLKISAKKEESLDSGHADKTVPPVFDQPQYTGRRRVFEAPDPTPDVPPPPKKKPKKTQLELEKFVGENLINKVGIIITIIGVAIGAKYSIEHNLINPLTRIIMGYITGTGLLVVGIRLKLKYENYSAALVSGGIAILYFITFFAYSLYGLIPQPLAFILMVVFTVFAVVASISYNRQFIAHIGLVGAYAVPFLLSDESGKPEILFSYIAIINLGILVISFKRYWKKLYYVSFTLTWLIFFAWYLISFNPGKYFTIALTFLSVFFVIFYLTLLAYKLLRKETFNRGDITLLLANSFIFYGVGYNILSYDIIGKQLLGLFTLLNALLHFIASVIIYRKMLGDRNLFFLVSGLVLVFITIAIPVQLDGNWVTLLWAVEAALLFWIGKTRNVPVYEKLSYPLMLLAGFSIAQDWGDYFYSGLLPIFNVYFLSSLIFIAAFAFINYIHQQRAIRSDLQSEELSQKALPFVLPGILLMAIYMTPLMEIINFWQLRYEESKLEVGEQRFLWNEDIPKFQVMWVLHYTFLFACILAAVNLKKIKNKTLALVNLCLIGISLFAFLSAGLESLKLLRESYLEPAYPGYFNHGTFNIGIRYISIISIAILLLVTDRFIIKQFLPEKEYSYLFDFVLHSTTLILLGNELIHWMDIAESKQTYKLGLSILFGVYALFLIILGIWKKKSYLRIGAFVLLAMTLVKVILYDLAHLDTISKTIVFVSLGVLLLIISFLYNKYKNLITNDKENSSAL